MKIKSDNELNIRQNIIFPVAKQIANEMIELMDKRAQEEFEKHVIFKGLDESEQLSFWGKIINVTNAKIYLHLKQVMDAYGCNDMSFNDLITDINNGTRIVLGLPVHEHTQPKKPDEPRRIITRGV